MIVPPEGLDVPILDRSWLAAVIRSIDERSTGRTIAFARQQPDDPIERSAGRSEETIMKKAIVVYRSHSGVTRRYGEEIAAFLNG